MRVTLIMDSSARTGIGIAISSINTLGAAPAQGALLTGSFFWIRPIAFSAVRSMPHIIALLTIDS